MRTWAVLITAVVALIGGSAGAADGSGLHYEPVCPQSAQVRCFSGILARADGVAAARTSETAGWTAGQLEAAYGLTDAALSDGTDKTVAIVDASDDPNAERDMATYRLAYGLPSCTSASGCFRKVNQSGQSSPLPKPDQKWAEEISLDLDMVSAACPRCRIVLVESDGAPRNPTDPISSNLMAAEQAALSLSPAAVSNSWGYREQQSQTTFDPTLQASAGTAVVAAAGDGGYGTEWPASASNVISVGGTVLAQDAATARGWSEKAWTGTGSGCSRFEAQPAWQLGLVPTCGRRVMNDVAAVAKGIAVYDTYKDSGWMVFRGTSASAPMVAAMIALAGGQVDSPEQLYEISQADPGAFNDVTAGSNGSCKPRILCHAQVGWDGPTGLGTPSGLSAFQPQNSGGGGGTAGHPLAAGYAQTCALHTSNVDCWGQNYFGQLGNGTTTGSTTPVAVEGLTDAAAVGSGTDVSCALLTSGRVDCWGSNTYGSLGDGTTNDSTTAVAVANLSDATMLGTVGLTSCVLRSDASVACWGYDSDGQLGDAGAFNNGAYSSTAVAVQGVTNATAVSVGDYHACALLTGGNLKCWGRGINGQLGNGTTTTTSTPVSVAGITTATAISAGGYHACALLAGGSVKCWGQNTWGELGDGTTNDSSTPVAVSGITNAIAISAGLDHTCALLGDGSVRCWGRGDYGQLGDATFAGSSTPVAVTGLSGATTVSAGGFHTCAQLADGTIECWGRNTDGQLGNGTTTDSTTPVAVSALP